MNLSFLTYVLAAPVLALTPATAEEPAPAFANETAPPVTSEETIEIPGPVADGTPLPPAPAPVIPDLVPISSLVHRVEVTEAPPMAGLPAVTGTISVTTRKVEDPKLPELPLPADPNNPAVQARLAEFREKYQRTQLLFVSATVYDHHRTYVRIFPNGENDGEIAGWSNIDFNYFSGFSSFRVTEEDGSFRDYGLLMGIGNTDAVPDSDLTGSPGIPEIPELTTTGPSFVVTKGGEGEALTALRQLHQLYKIEGNRLKDAFVGREAAESQRRAFLLAHPPKPQDVVMHYWRGVRSETSTVEGGDQ